MIVKVFMSKFTDVFMHCLPDVLFENSSLFFMTIWNLNRQLTGFHLVIKIQQINYLPMAMLQNLKNLIFQAETNIVLIMYQPGFP